jgi:hypothetical protein
MPEAISSQQKGTFQGVAKEKGKEPEIDRHSLDIAYFVFSQ